MRKIGVSWDIKLCINWTSLFLDYLENYHKNNNSDSTTELNRRRKKSISSNSSKNNHQQFQRNGTQKTSQTSAEIYKKHNKLFIRYWNWTLHLKCLQFTAFILLSFIRFIFIDIYIFLCCCRCVFFYILLLLVLLLVAIHILSLL